VDTEPLTKDSTHSTAIGKEMTFILDFWNELLLDICFEIMGEDTAPPSSTIHSSLSESTMVVRSACFTFLQFYPITRIPPHLSNISQTKEDSQELSVQNALSYESSFWALASYMSLFKSYSGDFRL
jgi:hypothetical protein